MRVKLVDLRAELFVFGDAAVDHEHRVFIFKHIAVLPVQTVGAIGVGKRGAPEAVAVALLHIDLSAADRGHLIFCCFLYPFGGNYLFSFIHAALRIAIDNFRLIFNGHIKSPAAGGIAEFIHFPHGLFYSERFKKTRIKKINECFTVNLADNGGKHIKIVVHIEEKFARFGNKRSIEKYFYPVLVPSYLCHRNDLTGSHRNKVTHRNGSGTPFFVVFGEKVGNGIVQRYFSLRHGESYGGGGKGFAHGIKNMGGILRVGSVIRLADHFASL